MRRKRSTITPWMRCGNLTDFSLVICKPDRKVIYSGCEWSGIQEDGELNATVAERVTLTAARRIETTA